MKIMPREIAKFCAPLTNTKAVRCYSVVFYVILCLLGNIVTGMVLYCHYNCPDKSEHPAGFIKNINDNSNKISDKKFENDSNLTDDWISSLEEGTGKILDPLLKEKSNEVNYEMNYDTPVF